MVDVGYFIDGRHGVIRNVTPLSNTTTEHLCFMQANGEEQYALKKENIEYVIPSDIDCVSGKIVFDKDGVTEYNEDGSVTMRGRYVENKNLLPPKPMTNEEKFKEVFGFEPNTALTMCDLASCDNFACGDNCPYAEICYDWWNEKYTGEFHVDTN